mgnify:CR=1 FL=1
MALNYNSRYPLQTDVDAQFYPYGKAKNVSADDAADGFPFERDYINDQFGFFQKLLVESGTTPNGNVDTALSSQYFNALQNVISNVTYSDAEGIVAGITTRVDNLDGEISDAQIELSSTIDELGVVSSRAYLGVTDTVDGKADITGVVFDSQTNGIRFRGDIFELTTSDDQTALYFNNDTNEWVFNGKLVIGGSYEVNSEDDIRALDGKDGQTVGSTIDWQFLNTDDNWQQYGITFTPTSSYLNVVTTETNSYLYIDGLSIQGAADNVISLRIRNNNATANFKMDAFYTTSGHIWDEGYKKNLPAVNLRQEVWETVIFDMRALTSGESDWIDNTVTGIRLDITELAGQDFDIDNIAIGHYGTAEKAITYTWIKYADDASGNGLSNDPTGKEYIGLAYNKDTPVESDTASDYTFALIKGTDGVDGETGYTWIAYSDFPDGTNLYQLPNEGTLYIGIAVNKPTPTESNDKTLYTWSKFKGDEGVAGQDGASGEAGAGFYGSLYAVIDWTTSVANTRFETLVGRPPVPYDVFTQTRTDGTDSQSRSYKGGVWVAPELLVNGDIIATGSIAGDKFIAGTEINAPVVNGGVLRGANVEMIGTNFMKVQSANPFGPNQLIEWYGSKVGNISGNEPIYNNLTKTNAITYLGDDGSAYFGGSIIAGALSTSKSTATLGSTMEVDTGFFGSNGGQIAIVCSVFSSSTRQDQGVCENLVDPSVEIRLYQYINSIKTLVKTQNFTGEFSCAQEGSDRNTSWFVSGSFTYYDNDLSTDNRSYRVECTLEDMGVSNRDQRLSIVTQEA